MTFSVRRLVHRHQVVFSEIVHQLRLHNPFQQLGNKCQVRDWPVILSWLTSRLSFFSMTTACLYLAGKQPVDSDVLMSKVMLLWSTSFPFATDQPFFLPRRCKLLYSQMNDTGSQSNTVILTTSPYLCCRTTL